MRFKDLAIGDIFDFDNERIAGMYFRCTKISPRMYLTIDQMGKVHQKQVGTINCEVFHVKQKETK